VLGLLQAEAPDVAVSAGIAARFGLGQVCLRAVLDQRNTVLAGNAGQLDDRRRRTERCTAMIAFVRGEIAASTAAGSRIRSAVDVGEYGTAFCIRIGMIVPKSLIGLVMISSPGSG